MLLEEVRSSSFLFYNLSERLAGKKVNLVLLGLSGTGKSASGNTILGREQFLSKPSAKAVTTKCQVAETKINGALVRVIDTPDIFNEDLSISVKKKQVKQCKELCHSEHCVFLLVIQVGRFTDGERDILTKIEREFGSRAQQHTILLFTCGEELQRADMNLEDFLQSCPRELKQIVEMCEYRCVLFDNKSPIPQQMEKLMQKVEEMF